MKNHPAAEVFPLLDAAELRGLAADIKERGLVESIKTYRGEILDGRNRFKACQMVGVQPVFEEYSGDDPWGYSWSLNFKRRHLTESQRAMAATKYWSPVRGRPKSTAQAVLTKSAVAEKALVSEDLIDRAVAIRRDAPANVIKAVEAGGITVSQAVALVKTVGPEVLSAASNTDLKLLDKMAKTSVDSRIENVAVNLRRANKELLAIERMKIDGAHREALETLRNELDQLAAHWQRIMPLA